MGFIDNIREKVTQLMYGRNGIDRMNRSLIWLYLIVYIGGAFLTKNESGVTGTSITIDTILCIILAVVVYRAFSKDLTKRRRENQAWRSFWWKFRTGNVDAWTRKKDAEHKYFTCKNCKTTCRVPAGKGKVVITCPKCGAKIQGKT